MAGTLDDNWSALCKGCRQAGRHGWVGGAGDSGRSLLRLCFPLDAASGMRSSVPHLEPAICCIPSTQLCPPPRNGDAGSQPSTARKPMDASALNPPVRPSQEWRCWPRCRPPLAAWWPPGAQSAPGTAAARGGGRTYMFVRLHSFRQTEDGRGEACRSFAAPRLRGSDCMCDDAGGRAACAAKPASTGAQATLPHSHCQGAPRGPGACEPQTIRPPAEWAPMPAPPRRRHRRRLPPRHSSCPAPLRHRPLHHSASAAADGRAEQAADRLQRLVRLPARGTRAHQRPGARDAGDRSW